MADHGGATVPIRAPSRPTITAVVPRLRFDAQLPGALRAIVGDLGPAAAWCDITRRLGAAVQAELERFVADHRVDELEEQRGGGIVRGVSHGALELSRFAAGVAGRMRDAAGPAPLDSAPEHRR
jgi:hypothetical protein